MENLSVKELKEKIIQSLKAGRTSSAELWYKRYRTAGGKMTYSQIKSSVKR